MKPRQNGGYAVRGSTHLVPARLRTSLLLLVVCLATPSVASMQERCMSGTAQLGFACGRSTGLIRPSNTINLLREKIELPREKIELCAFCVTSVI
jgi:hypothetical protein